LLLLRLLPSSLLFFLFNVPATTEIYTLSLHDALPISPRRSGSRQQKPTPARDGRFLEKVLTAFTGPTGKAPHSRACHTWASSSWRNGSVVSSKIRLYRWCFGCQ